MKYLLIGLAGLFAGSVCAHSAPFEIDVEAVADIAVKTVMQKFPTITREDLALEQDSMSAFCNLLDDDESGSTPSDPCFMQVTFTLPTSVEQTRYVNDEGNCTTVTGANTVTVFVKSDGSATASAGGGSGQYTMPCTNDFLDSLD